MTDYGKSKEIDAYVQRLTYFKEKYPEHIIFRNKNLSHDINVEIAKIDQSQAPMESDRGEAYVTRSPFSPTMKRIPPVNIARALVSAFHQIYSILDLIPKIQAKEGQLWSPLELEECNHHHLSQLILRISIA